MPLRISLTRFTLVSFWSICLVWYLSIMNHTFAEFKSGFFSFMKLGLTKVFKVLHFIRMWIPGHSVADRQQEQPVLWI